MIDREIKRFVLTYLLSKNGSPVSHTELKNAIRTAFSAALTDGDLGTWISQCDDAGWTATTNDEIFGLIMALTPKGKIKAQQL